MRLKKYQKGLSVWSLSFAMFIAGFAIFTTLKLFPVYMEDFSVSSVIESMDREPEEYRGALSVQQTVRKRFSVNNVTRVTRDDISVTRDGPLYKIEVNYEVIVPFIGNLSFLLDFKHKASVRASV